MKSSGIMYWLVGIGVVLFILVGAISIHQDPLKVISRKVLNPEIHSGENIRIRISAERLRACPTSVFTYISKDQEGEVEVVWRNEMPMSQTDLMGTREWISEVPTPPLPLGKYIYNTTFWTRCGDIMYRVSLEPVRFTVK